MCLCTDDELRFLPDYASRVHEMVRLPIRDGGTAADDELVRLVQQLAARLRSEEESAMYVHCLAGRGRTGVVCACLLGAVYGASAELALTLIQRFHDSRVSPFGKGARSPENSMQRDQVVRTIARNFPQSSGE